MTTKDKPQLNGVKSLSLHNFRNYQHMDFSTNSSTTVITGCNGAGKTNILEALSFLIPGRGLRASHLQEVQNVYQTNNPWAVSAIFQIEGKNLQIGTGLDPKLYANHQYKRIVSVQGTLHKTHNILSQYVKALWLTPQQDRLFIDGSGDRRNFLDRLVFSLESGHATRLNKYEHAARERAKLIKTGQLSISWLEALEEQIASQGIIIEQARYNMVEQLNNYLQKNISCFPLPIIQFKSAIYPWIHEGSIETAQGIFREKLATTRNEQERTGRMPIGVQRSDMATLYVEKNMPAELCSTGEQKALLISILLASARCLHDNATGASLLLLDEVVAHLDRHRQIALFHELAKLKMQVWITGVEKETFEYITDACFLSVNNGLVS